jgi:peroxiredoxin
MAVNDIFVMNAWGNDQGAKDKVMMLSDGNGEYVEKLGLEMDASNFGMGTRGQRFAIVIKNGVVKHIAVEEPGDFNVTKATSVLESI